MRSLIVTLILINLLAYSSACVNGNDDCNNTPDERTFEFTDDTGKIHYLGTDTLIFQHSDSVGLIIDTITLIGQGREYSRKFLYDEPIGTICPAAIYANKYSVNFKESTTNIIPISISLTASSSGTDANIRFFNQNLPFTLWDLSNPVFSGYKVNYNVLGKTFFNVSEYIDTSGLYIDTTYINSKFGVIKIVEGNNIWQLIP